MTLQMMLFLPDCTVWVFLKAFQQHLHAFLWLLSNSICKRISRVSRFSDWCSFEKICHKSEKTLSDSALDNGATRHISRMCNKLWIPKSSPMQKFIGQHFSGTCLLMWSERISSSFFKWSMWQLLTRSRSLKCSTITFTSLKIMSSSRNLYDSKSSIMPGH